MTLDKIINSDEAATFGTVYMHGNSSGLLRVKEMVLVDETRPIMAESAPTPLNGANMGKAKNRHAKMVEDEEARKKREAAKSGLEAWIYSIKEKAMEEDFEKIADEDEIAMIRKQLEEGEEWLYEDGESVDIPAYTAKKDEINTKVGPATERYDQFLERPLVLEAATGRINKALESAASWGESRPQIPAGDLIKLERLAKELQQTLKDGEAKLTGEGLRGPLPFTTDQITKKAEGIKDLSDTLKLIKPKAKGEGKEL